MKEKNKSKFTGLFAASLAFLILLGQAGCVQKGSINPPDKRINGTICSGPTTGTYYKYADGIIEAADSKLNMNLENLSTNGSLENAVKMADGTCNMALLQEDLFKYALEKSAEGDISYTKMASKIQTILVAYNEDVHLLVNINSIVDANNDEVIDVKDLSGKKIGVGEENSGTYITATFVLRANGVENGVDGTTFDNTAPSDAIAKVQSGDLDAMFVVAAVPYAPFESEDMVKTGVQLMRVTIPDDVPFDMYGDTGEIGSSDYPFQVYQLDNNLQVKALIVASKDLERSDFYGFADYLVNNKGDLAINYSLAWSAFTLADSVDYVGKNPIIWKPELAEFVTGYFFDKDEMDFYSGAYGGGSYFFLAKDLIPLIESEMGHTLTNVESTGSAENAVRIFRGSAVFSLVQDDVFDYLSGRNDPYEGTKVTSMRKVMEMYKENIHILVNRLSGIDSPEDFESKKICVCEKSSGSFVSAYNIISSYGFDRTNAPTYYFAATDVCLEGVIDGSYDVMFKTADAPYSLFQDIATSDKRKVRLIPAKVKSGSFVYKYPTHTLAQSVYPDLIDESGGLVDTSQVSSVLVVHHSFDEADINDLITKVYAENDAGSLSSTEKWSAVSRESGVEYFKQKPLGWSKHAVDYFSSYLSR